MAKINLGFQLARSFSHLLLYVGQGGPAINLRLTLAEGRWLLAHIPLGTPALISS